ncbi:MAG: acylphosphatase [Candidatus Bathyarchaeia archaeon]
MQKLTRMEATVQGEVQRVGYRYIVQDTARRLGIKGYVQNMPDGTVKIVAEASEDVIQKFIEALKVKEPPMVVESIQVSYSKPTGEFPVFIIKYGDLTEEMAEGFGTGLKYISLSRDETREGFQTLRSEMKGGFETLRTEMRGGFEVLRTETKEGFQTLRSDMKEGFQTLRTETKEGFQALGSEIKGMREDMNRNFEEMSGKYEAISQNLGQAIKILQEESTKTRNELTRAVDNLSRLVEEFVRARRSEEQHHNTTSKP